MRPSDYPARAVEDDPVLPSPDESHDIAVEDWGILFDAVVERLRSTSEALDVGVAPRRSLTLAQARLSIAECAQALDQLQRTAAHELSRCQPADGVARASRIRPAGVLNARNFPENPFEVVRTIWHTWHDNRRARVDGMPPA